VHQADLIINRKDFRAGETEPVRGVFAADDKRKGENQGR